MAPEKDYTHRSWIAVTLLIAVLIGLSLIPPQTLGGVSLRRVNILSDLISFEEDLEKAEKAIDLDDADFHIDLTQVARQIADTVPQHAPTTYEWNLREEADDTTAQPRLPDSVRLSPTLIPIEDFDTTGHSRLTAFYEKLQKGDAPVRIAVMGDSFVEGDILSSDLREKLQLRFGGSGAGFAPMASPLTGFRRTIKTQSKGWDSYNIMQRRNTPAAISDYYYISGWLCQPSDGASVRWEGSSDRACLDSCRTARILFVSRDDSRIEVTVNDRDNRTFDIEGSPAVRQIVVHDDIRSLSFKVLSGAAGAIGYGAIFESAPGVVVDNYSIRSNNGQAMFWTSPTVNAQINEMLGYDLVILQYGLNILEPGIRSFAKYGEQIEKMIAYIRQCFPTAAVLVMSVSDRSVKSDSGFVPMDSAPYMAAAQRQAAQNSGAAFWSAYDAMQSLGGMAQFVANGWAGKDYTHINFAGGRRVAWALYDAINRGAEQHPPFTPVAHDNVIDTRKISHLEMMLRQAARPRMQKP